MHSLYYNLFIVDLAKFRWNPFLLMTINGDGKFCFGTGYDTDEIKLQVLMSQRLTDCSKTLLQNLCDFSNSWSGYNAKWLENCGQGQDAEIKLYQHTFKYAENNHVWGGTANPVSSDWCFQFVPTYQMVKKASVKTWDVLNPAYTPKVATSQNVTGYLTRMLFDNLWAYLER